MYLHPKNRLVSFHKRQKCSVSTVFEFSHDAVFKMRQSEFRSQSLLFSQSAGKTTPSSCEREACSSHFENGENFDG